jgi:hypothetical protein
MIIRWVVSVPLLLKGEEQFEAKVRFVGNGEEAGQCRGLFELRRVFQLSRFDPGTNQVV